MLSMKWILFIVDLWENAEKETLSHTKWSWSPFGNTVTPILASRCPRLSTEWLYSARVARLPFPVSCGCRPRKGFMGNLPVCYLLDRDWCCSVDCIPVLLEMNIGIYMPMALELPTHLIGPENTITSISPSSSAFQFPLGLAPLAGTWNPLWRNLPFPAPQLLHLISQSHGILFWISRNLHVVHVPDL